MTKITGEQLKDYDVPYVLKTSAPTASDAGYSVPTLWLDTSTDIAYLLTDNAGGVATWMAIGYTVTIKDSEFIPIEWAINGDVPPDAAETISSGSGEIVVRKFSGTASQDVKIPWEVPPDLAAGGEIKFQAVGVITEATAPSNEGISFKLSGYSVDDDESIGGPTGSESESKKTGMSHAQYDLFKTDLSDAVTIAGLGSGELALLKLYRDHDDTDDSYAQKIGVSGVVIKFTREMDNSWKS